MPSAAGVGETYNVGGRNERRNIDVVTRDLRADGSPSLRQRRPARELINSVTDRPGHDARYAIDATKLESELGWRAQENFDSGIEKTVQWYLDNEWWWQPLRDGYVGAAARADRSPQQGVVIGMTNRRDRPRRARSCARCWSAARCTRI